MMLKQYKFDLLIVDIMMPEESGLEFLAGLRKEDNVPVILLTAMGETLATVSRGWRAVPTIICRSRLNPRNWF